MRDTAKRLAGWSQTLAASAIWVLNLGAPEALNLRSLDESARLTRTLTIAPEVPLSVDATVSDVFITGWDRPDTAVDIVRKGPNQARLSTLEPSIEERDGRVLVRATQAGESLDRSITSTIRINLPSASAVDAVNVADGRIVLTNLKGRVSANTRNGSIAATRLSGTIRLETLTGDITLEDATLVPEGLIRLRAFNGQVKLQFARRPQNARILALTFNGTISSDLPLTTKDRFGPRFAEATLGSGSPVVSIDVVTGNIQIKAPAK